MRRIAFAVRAIKLQKHVSGEKKPLTPYVEASATTLNSLQLAWHLTEAQRKLAETKGAKFTSLLEMCDPETLDWQPVYRGNEFNCSVEELAPSTVYLFRLKVFESEDQESNSKWSECISGQTRDEPPSAKSLHKEIEFGNHQEVSRILQIIPIAASSCASDAGLTSLQTAVVGSDLKMVKMLLQHCNIDAESIGNGRTALMMACAAGKADVAEYLLENGANIEKQDRIGMTALHHSLLHARMAKLILDAGAAVDAADSCGWTPLMRAVLLGCEPQVVRLLINHGAHVNHRDVNGLSCLAAAVFAFAPDHAVLRLLREAGADVHAPADSLGHSALQLASKDIVAILSPAVNTISCPPVVKIRADSQEQEKDETKERE
ncbi:Hypothetical predicted protein [Cloeon dipterum]|uniref:Fibronectin type-III domain-containing protein n=1 Tax=Cloeon dipterum TaxID=197152 RepID=A0A8S1D781_9INSE|nr:Hypothetical predicted protein [Cloeon dipterum]